MARHKGLALACNEAAIKRQPVHAARGVLQVPARSAWIECRPAVCVVHALRYGTPREGALIKRMTHMRASDSDDTSPQRTFPQPVTPPNPEPWKSSHHCRVAYCDGVRTAMLTVYGRLKAMPVLTSKLDREPNTRKALTRKGLERFLTLACRLLSGGQYRAGPVREA